MNQFVIKTNSYFLFLVVCLIIVSAIRIHLINVPLERDEGEYAYAGQLLLEGVPPFSQAYNMKMPGIYVAYAGILACFGQTSSSIHLGLLIVNILCSVMLYFLGKRLFNRRVGCVAGIAFSALSLGSSVLGLSANAEHFVVLFALAGFLLLLRAQNRPHNALFFLSGFMLGMCFLMKQHGMAFVLCGMIVLVWNELYGHTADWKKTVVRFLFFCAGAVVPFALICLWLWRAGVFGQFWFWTFTYAQAYVSQVGFRHGLRLFSSAFTSIIMSSPLFWLLALGGWLSLLFEKTSYTKLFFVVAFVVASFAALCPGFFFREHYFILLLPAVSLLSGIGLNAVCTGVHQRVRWKPAGWAVFCAIAATSLAVSFFIERRLLFQLPPLQVSRSIYGINPFPESCVIADSLMSWTSPDEKIAVIGSEPQIYFYSQRRSATGYVYTYALMEIHPFALQMQENMIRDIESGRPAYLVFVNVPQSWLVRPHSHTAIFEWFNRYQRDFYEIAGIADIVSYEKTEYRWGDDAKKYVPRSPFWLTVLKRKTTAETAH
jgi:hypothetical protein